MAVSISNSEKLGLMSTLATMMSAGIPLLETIDSLLEDAKGNQKKILLMLRNDVSQGKTISSSLEKFTHVFDPVTINLLKAAEEAGNLDTTLKDLTANIKKDIEFSDKVKGALAYPLLVMGVFFFIFLGMLIFVIPRIAKVFSQLRVNIPLPTQIFISVSSLLLTYYPYFIAGCAVLLIASYYLYNINRRLFLHLVTSLPIVSKLAANIDFTRFSRSMALLLSSGIPIVEALELSDHVIAKKEIAYAVAKSQEMVTSGHKLSEGLKKAKKIFPSIMIRIIGAGEKSGGLDVAFQELSDHFEYRVESSLKTVTTLLEPALLVIMGLLVGGMMLAVIAPIYGLISQISIR